MENSHAFPRLLKPCFTGHGLKGNYKAGSDIDLTLEGKKLSADLRSTIATALDDLLLPYSIDLSIRSSIQDSDLNEHINRVGVIVYQSTHLENPQNP